MNTKNSKTSITIALAGFELHSAKEEALDYIKKALPDFSFNPAEVFIHTFDAFEAEYGIHYPRVYRLVINGHISGDLSPVYGLIEHPPILQGVPDGRTNIEAFIKNAWISKQTLPQNLK